MYLLVCSFIFVFVCVFFLSFVFLPESCNQESLHIKGPPVIKELVGG